MAKKSGQEWRAICSRRIEGGTSVGCGDGSRTGRDGRFAHKECYEAQKGDNTIAARKTPPAGGKVEE